MQLLIIWRKERHPVTFPTAGRVSQRHPRPQQQDVPGPKSETGRRSGDLPDLERDVAGVRGARPGGDTPSR